MAAKSVKNNRTRAASLAARGSGELLALVSQMNERLAQLQLMSDISKSFLTKEPLGDTIRAALARMGAFLNVVRVLIAVFEKDSEISRPEYAWFVGPQYRPNTSQRGFSGVIRELFPRFHSGDGEVPSIYCDNTLQQENGRFRLFYERGGLKSFICSPIYVDGELWGVMSIEEHERFRGWTQSDTLLVSAVSSAISNAVARDIMEKERAAALEQALRASRAKGDFLSNMSHEMRTPMNAIIGMTAIGRAAGDIARKDYAFDKIDDASKHLLGVINDILDMSKIEANKLELSPTVFEFGRVLQNVVGVINFRADERRQRLHVDIDGDIPLRLVGDDQRLAQVITNLLSNAVKFSPEEGVINLRAALLSDGDGMCRLQITVEDRGIGITEEQKCRLFRSFEQAEAGTSRKYGGTGLGLAISKRIVELMGGEIWVESEQGQGAKFYFTANFGLPDLDSPQDPDGQAEPGAWPRADGRSGADATGGERGGSRAPDDFTGRTVLLAEDVEINREIIAALLEPVNLAVECAENGARALEMFREEPDRYDLIFMDVQMPEMDGYEATRRIRALPTPRAREVPIVAMTANVFREDVERCMEAGMDAHISKPLNYNEVVAALRKYI